MATQPQGIFHYFTAVSSQYEEEAGDVAEVLGELS